MKIIPHPEQTLLDFSEPLPQLKLCRKCGERKPLEEFCVSYNLRCGRVSNCRACHRKWGKECYRRTKGRASRNCHLRDTYGITLEEYNAKLMAQGMMCAICGKKAPSLDSSEWGKYSYPVDHCHETKKVRGILCPQCNSGLGHFKDRPELLRSAIRYLQQSAKVHVGQAHIPLFDDYEPQT